VLLTKANITTAKPAIANVRMHCSNGFKEDE